MLLLCAYLFVYYVDWCCIIVVLVVRRVDGLLFIYIGVVVYCIYLFSHVLYNSIERHSIIRMCSIYY